MGKPSPIEKHPDGKGNRGGGGVCGSCGGAGGRYIPQATVDSKGKAKSVDTWKACGSCGGSGRR